MDLNLNNADCIKGTYNLLSATYHNICTGDITNVAYGLADIGSMILISIVVAAMARVFLSD